jgi:transcriptional regulator with PAS, ATPase and Fis domain
MKVIIVEPKGANSIFRKKIPKTIFIYLETDQLIRRVRMLNRGDKLEDVETRFKEDKKHFRKSRFTHLDHIVNTSSHTLEELAEKIHDLYMNDLKNQD